MNHWEISEKTVICHTVKQLLRFIVGHTLDTSCTFVKTTADRHIFFTVRSLQIHSRNSNSGDHKCMQYVHTYVPKSVYLRSNPACEYLGCDNLGPHSQIFPSEHYREMPDSHNPANCSPEEINTMSEAELVQSSQSD